MAKIYIATLEQLEDVVKKHDILETKFDDYVEAEKLHVEVKKVVVSDILVVE